LARKNEGIPGPSRCVFRSQERVVAGHGAAAKVSIGSAARESRFLFPNPRRLVAASDSIDDAIMECAWNVERMPVFMGVSAISSWTACAAETSRSHSMTCAADTARPCDRQHPYATAPLGI